jgi:alpha-tubulin suppressor-like RCC1 family protein
MPTPTKKRVHESDAVDEESDDMSMGSPDYATNRRRVQSKRNTKVTKVELNMVFLKRKESLWQQGMEQINEETNHKVQAILAEVPVDPDRLALAIAENLRAQDEMESRYNRTPGRVVVMGSDDCNQLGFVTAETEDNEKESSYPPTMKPLDKMVQVAAGGLHSAARTNDGKVYTWGCNDKGVLGRTTKTAIEESVAQVIDESQMDTDDRGQIVGMSAGESHCLFLTIRGNVYTTGMLKDADSGEFRNIPKGAPHKECEGMNEVAIKVDGFKQPVRAIASGGSFNAAILQDCSLVTWGKLFLYIKMFLLMSCWIGHTAFSCACVSTLLHFVCFVQHVVLRSLSLRGAHDSSFAKKLMMF